MITTIHKKYILHYDPQPNGTFKIVGKHDASFAPGGDKSITGFVIFINGKAVKHVSRRQTVIATSAPHAETIACFECSKAMVAILNTWKDIVEIELPMQCYGDNTGSLKYNTEEVCSERTRHWDIALRYQHEVSENGTIKYNWQDGNDLCADVLTKPLSKEKHEQFTQEIGIV